MSLIEVGEVQAEAGMANPLAGGDLGAARPPDAHA